MKILNRAERDIMPWQLYRYRQDRALGRNTNLLLLPDFLDPADISQLYIAGDANCDLRTVECKIKWWPIPCTPAWKSWNQIASDYYIILPWVDILFLTFFACGTLIWGDGSLELLQLFGTKHPEIPQKSRRSGNWAKRTWIWELGISTSLTTTNHC